MAPALNASNYHATNESANDRRLRSAAENFASEILEEIDLEQLTYGRSARSRSGLRIGARFWARPGSDDPAAPASIGGAPGKTTLTCLRPGKQQ